MTTLERTEPDPTPLEPQRHRLRHRVIYPKQDLETPIERITERSLGSKLTVLAKVLHGS